DGGGGGGSVALSPDGKGLATIRAGGSVGLWGVATGNQLRRVDAQGPNGAGLFRLLFSPDGKILGGMEDRAVVLWSTANGRQLYRIENQGTLSSEGMMVWESAAFSADGRLVATVGPNNIINLWETATGKQVRQYKGHQGWGSALAFC